MLSSRAFLVILLLCLTSTLLLLTHRCTDQQAPAPAPGTTRAARGAPQSLRAHHTGGSASASQTREPVATAAELPATVLAGRVMDSDGEVPLAGCRVGLFLYRVPETFQRRQPIIEPRIAWTDADGRFEFVLEFEPDSEWRGSLLAQHTGTEMANVPISMEAGRHYRLPALRIGEMDTDGWRGPNLWGGLLTLRQVLSGRARRGR